VWLIQTPLEYSLISFMHSFVCTITFTTNYPHTALTLLKKEGDCKQFFSWPDALPDVNQQESLAGFHPFCIEQDS